MQMQIKLLVLTLLLVASLLLPQDQVCGQSIKHYPDGTIVVNDDEFDAAGSASPVLPLRHKVSQSCRKAHKYRRATRQPRNKVRRGHKNTHGRHKYLQGRHKYSRSGNKQSSQLSYTRSPAYSGSGKIPAYTRNMGGVTIKRHADGTVDVVDNNVSSGRPARRSAGHAHGSKTGYGSDVVVTKHPDGKIEVEDASFSVRQPR